MSSSYAREPTGRHGSESSSLALYLLFPSFKNEGTPLLFQLSISFWTSVVSFEQKVSKESYEAIVIRPESCQLSSFVRTLPKHREFEASRVYIIVHGLIRDEYVVEEFITSCFNVGAPELALFAFRSIRKPLQNLIIRRLCDHGLFEDVLGVYLKCRFLGCPSDDFTFPSVIKACSALDIVWFAEGLHGVLRTGFEENLVIQTALVDCYEKTGRTVKARRVLDRISQPDLVTWNALISSYSLHGFDNKVFLAFRQIRMMGFKPDAITFVSAIPLCSRMKYLDVGKSIHGFVVKSGLSSGSFLTPSWISMYAGGRNLFIARDSFNSVAEKNVGIWNSMISAYAQNQECTEACKTFQQMLQANVQPNVITFVSIIPCSENSDHSW